MPREMNVQGIDLPPNDALSQLDKAFATVHYPYFGDDAKKHPDADFQEALEVLGIAPPGYAEQGDDMLLPDSPQGTESTATTNHADGNGANPVVQPTVLPDLERESKIANTKEIMAMYDERDWVGIRQKVKEVYASTRSQKRMKSVL